MVSSADRARQKAEARRARILARSSQRLDVVNGVVPSNSIAVAPSSATSLEGASVASGVVVDVAPAPAEDKEAAAAVVATVESGESTAPPAATGDGDDAPVAEEAAASSGSRRMAAMRRRRYGSKRKPKEEPKEAEVIAEVDTSGSVKNDAKPEVENVGDNATADSTVVENVVEKGGEKTEEKEELKKQDDKSDDAAKSEPVLVETKDLTPPTNQKETEPVEKDDKETPVVVSSAPTTNVDEKKEEESKPKAKKYMGVARMRRKILKEKKAQRLKDIADADIMTSDDTSPVLERELAAEMAAMDMTATMVRSGGMVVDESKSSLSRMLNMKKSLKKRWFAALVPPMKLVPRLVTLFLLFFAGLDLGMQPHSGGSRSVVTDAGSVASGDVSGVGGLIQQVEPALTKPWEYGMGGKAAFMMGMAPTSPPTSLPTSFNDAGMVCGAAYGDGSMKECLAATGETKSDTKVKKNKGGKKKSSIKVQLMEDELDSSRTLPRGVSHDDEFADAGPTTVGKSNNIDPLFQVDLDALLQKADLPFPIDLAAKCAIGFHRAWVYYLWTLPTSLMKTMVYAPKNLLSGLAYNPPWILGVALLIRFVVKVLVGNSKSFSLDQENENSNGGSGNGAGDKHLDVLGKVVETAKNYATSMFPKTMLVMGTLLHVMKVDMYILLCGFLVGLVMPSVKEDFLAWSGDISWGGGGTSRPVLGDGEL